MTNLNATFHTSLRATVPPPAKRSLAPFESRSSLELHGHAHRERMHAVCQGAVDVIIVVIKTVIGS